MNILHASSISCGECIRKLDSLFWRYILIRTASYLPGRIRIISPEKDWFVSLSCGISIFQGVASYFILRTEVCKIPNLWEGGGASLGAPCVFSWRLKIGQIWGIFKTEDLKIQFARFEDLKIAVLSSFILVIWCLRLTTACFKSEDSKYAFVCWEPLLFN